MATSAGSGSGSGSSVSMVTHGAGSPKTGMSTAQIAACARFAVRVKQSGSSDGYRKLLNMFETLGVTSDVLKQGIQELSEASEANSPSRAPSSSR